MNRAMNTAVDSSSHLRIALIGGQMLFVAFGALVLVPLLTGIDPSVALFTAGVGTLIFQLCTRRKVPLFLGSSFAFIAPILYSVETWGMPATLSGLAAAGGFYLFLSLMVMLYGRGFSVSLVSPGCSWAGHYGDWVRAGNGCRQYGDGAYR